MPSTFRVTEEFLYKAEFLYAVAIPSEDPGDPFEVGKAVEVRGTQGEVAQVKLSDVKRSGTKPHIGLGVKGIAIPSESILGAEIRTLGNHPGSF